ncbi:MAG: hypothetical protein PHR28_13580, partial [candidate division Zixibacteria bacterium]|nr:hypothetical protein [candidate division Zixibacteria bacterium]
LNSAQAMASGSFTEIRLNHRKYAEAIWLFLNSSLGWLLIELSGRSGMGGGMLKVDPTDIRKMRVIDPSLIKRSLFPELDSLLNRRVESVDQECNAKDHRLIDDYILGDVLGLTESEQEEIRRSLIELVQARNTKASSVKNGKKSRNGIDLEKLTHDATHHDEVKELVQFLKTKVISEGIDFRRLPTFKGPVIIENTLLGWQVNNGSSRVECKSESEARFLKIFMEMRWNEVPVLAKGRLTSALARNLEKYFESASTVLEEYNSAILQRRIRDRFTRIFWAHVKEEVSKDG